MQYSIRLSNKSRHIQGALSGPASSPSTTNGFFHSEAQTNCPRNHRRPVQCCLHFIWKETEASRDEIAVKPCSPHNAYVSFGDIEKTWIGNFPFLFCRAATYCEASPEGHYWRQQRCEGEPRIASSCDRQP